MGVIIGRAVVFFFLITYLKIATADEIFSIEVGASYLPNNLISDKWYQEHVLSVGLIIGIAVPINIGFVDLHIKVERIRHRIDQITFNGRLLPYDFKFTSFNEYLLVGKKLKFNRIEILPQISFGRADEVGDTDNYGAAIRDHYWHLGFSLRIRRHGKKLWPGIIFQLQRGIHDVHAGDFRSSLKVKTALVITI
ncbi:MAG: hypothetical protein O7G31_00590 [Calditrichaeota bacterium]|nr:hypothetical protein [Calditrichota bacterium]